MLRDTISTNCMKKIITSLTLASLLLSPVSALAVTPVLAAKALTPTQIIRNSLESVLWAKPDHGATITTVIDFTGKDLKNVVKSRGNAEIHYNYEIQYRADGRQNSRFALTVPKASYLENGETKQWLDPVGFEVLSLGLDSTYVRLTHLNPEVQAILKEFNLNVDSIVGQWIKIPTEELLQESGLDPESIANLETEHNSIFTPAELLTLKNWYLGTVKKSGNPLTITRLGRATTNEMGQKVQTVRVAVNTRWYAAIENLVISEYKKSNPRATAREIAAERKSFNMSLAEFKKILSKMTTDVTVNFTTGSITDATINYSSREAAYEYDYQYVKGTFKSIKKLIGHTTTAIKTTANFRPVSILALEAPGQSLDGMKVWDMVYTKPVTRELDPPTVE